MININQGQLFMSSPDMDDPIFRQSTILITQQNASGTIGFIINRQHPRKLNELSAFSHTRPFPLYSGGPVADEQLFFLHRRPDLIDDGTLVKDAIYFGGNFKQVIQHISNGNLQQQDIRLFIGYCGWDAGELEAEVEEGNWIEGTDEGDIFGITMPG